MTQRGAAWLVVGGTLALSLASTTYSLLGARRRTPPVPAVPLGAVLGNGGATGFARADRPRAFSFPADDGPHPAFRSEWWYVTGVLHAGERRFGYQLTVFRQALAPSDPSAPPRASAWASRQVYMGNLALTDVGGKRFAAFERLGREGLDLGGARAQPFRVWVEDWSMSGPERGGPFPLVLRARQDDIELALTVGGGRGPVLQGDAGLSAKGPEPGNASYYYSYTRLPTSGRVAIGGVSFDVTGESWLDREWSTSALGPDLAGWDWLALHLSDGRDLMIYRLRRRDGSATAESRATLITAGPATRVLGPDGFTLTPTRWWRSPTTGVTYPVAVKVAIPSADLDLEVSPLLDDQELKLSVRYWEGAVEAHGRAGAAAVTGSGYWELTGY